jgi:hypothetical protein
MKVQACFQLKAKYIAKICCKKAKYIFAKWKTFLSASLYSHTRITLKTVHHIMEDNFALRYVLKHPGVNSRAELVPSHGASRRRLGDNLLMYINIYIYIYIYTCIINVAKQFNFYINLVSRLFPLRSWLEKIPWLGLVTCTLNSGWQKV